DYYCEAWDSGLSGPLF
nr:immunoglobulin light chain junction region [Macaca mulatta]